MVLFWHLELYLIKKKKKSIKEKKQASERQNNRGKKTRAICWALTFEQDSLHFERNKYNLLYDSDFTDLLVYML
jgi:hypothetical protein